MKECRPLAAVFAGLALGGCGLLDGRDELEEWRVNVYYAAPPSGREFPRVLLVVSYERFLPAEGGANVDWVLLPSKDGRRQVWLERYTSLHLLDLESGAISSRTLAAEPESASGWITISDMRLKESFFVELSGAYAKHPSRMDTYRLSRDGAFSQIGSIPAEARKAKNHGSETYLDPGIAIQFLHRRLLQIRSSFAGSYVPRFCLAAGSRRPISWKESRFDSCVDDVVSSAG